MRLVLLALAALTLAPAASAQLPSISVGVAGGPNFSNFSDVTGAEADGTTGFHIGVYGDVSIPLVAFRTGIYYLSAGDVQTAAGGNLVKADFITIPVDFRVQTPTPIVKAYLLAGPELRFPVGSIADGLVDRNSVNLAANIGVGGQFKAPLVGPSAFLELRYSADVTGFASAVNAIDTDNDYKVSLFQIRLGVGL